MQHKVSIKSKITVSFQKFTIEPNLQILKIARYDTTVLCIETISLLGLEDSILLLTDIWSFGVLTLELFHYGAHMIPFIRIYRQMEYANKLGEGWGPKIPTDVPLEINRLLRKCFRYKMENRSSAKDLLAFIQKFVVSDYKITNIVI